MDTPLVVDTPDDPEFLKQFARVSMLHAHLDNTLKMFVRSFEGRTIEGVLGLYRLPECGTAPGAFREARFACFRPGAAIRRLRPGPLDLIVFSAFHIQRR